MQTHKALATVLSSLLFCSYAYADVIYQNGSFNGTFQGAQISPPQGISDSFNVSNQAVLQSATVGLWVPADAVPVSLTWSIGSQPFGTEFGTGTVSLSNTLTVDNGAFHVYLSDFELNATLAAGDYYFTLRNATSTTGEAVGWDINFGPSSAFYMNGPEQGSTDSEFFRLDGTIVDNSGPLPVPEPASLAIFAGGLMGLVVSRRRRTGTMQ